LDGHYDDRNTATRTDHRLQCNLGTSGDDQIYLQPHQFGGDREGATGIIQPSIVDDNVLALAESELLQFGQEGLVLCGPSQKN